MRVSETATLCQTKPSEVLTFRELFLRVKKIPIISVAAKSNKVRLSTIKSIKLSSEKKTIFDK